MHINTRLCVTVKPSFKLFLLLLFVSLYINNVCITLLLVCHNLWAYVFEAFTAVRTSSVCSGWQAVAATLLPGCCMEHGQIADWAGRTMHVRIARVNLLSFLLWPSSETVDDLFCAGVGVLLACGVQHVCHQKSVARYVERTKHIIGQPR